MNKFIKIFFLTIIIAVLFYKPCLANEISVYINGIKVGYDTQPVIKNGRTLVPMRTTFNSLGADVEWLGDTRTVIAVSNSIVIAVQIDSNVLIRKDVETNSTETYLMDVAPCISENRTLIPLRAVGEALKCHVKWDEHTKTVTITNGSEAV